VDCIQLNQDKSSAGANNLGVATFMACSYPSRPVLPSVLTSLRM
jgi:hypothetical protein